jgi:UDP-3-O-[3-hydroxymyristoyl] glucosamine N-acyltransferase
MYKIKNNDLYTSEIAKYLDLSYVGNDILIRRPAEIGNRTDDVICFATEYDRDMLAGMDNICTIICSRELIIDKPNLTFIISETPLKHFARIVNEFFAKGVSHKIDPNAIVEAGARLGFNINIGRNSYIEGEVTIGNDTYIGNNVVIRGKVSIGSGCIIKDGAVIGTEGFAFIRDEEEVLHIPQLGDVIIGDDVWIGSNVTLEKPLFKSTKVGNSVKIDDLVHIGQGSQIGEGTQITAGSTISRNVVIGRNCFLGIGSIIKDRVKITDQVIIGMGTSVTQNIDKPGTYTAK